MTTANVIDTVSYDAHDGIAVITYVKVNGIWRYAYRAVDNMARVIDELLPRAAHNTAQHENNRCEADHGRLKAR